MDEQIGAEQQLSPWDRRVVRAMATAESARRAGPALRVLAAVLALVGLVGGLVYVSSDEFALGGTELRVGVFLGPVLTPVGLAALVLASSYLVQVAAARLDLDIVLADEDVAERGAGNDGDVGSYDLPEE